MKLVGNLFQDTPVSLEEGLAKCRSTNKYLVLHRDESNTNCGRFVQIVKVILCIELIILIGWLSCMSFSYYNTDRGVSAIGYKSSKIDYDGVEVKNSRRSRSVGDAEDGPEKCERNANAMRRRLDSFAAQFVTGESSNPTVVQLRLKFKKFMIRDYLHVIFAYSIRQALGALFSLIVPSETVSNTTNTNPFSTISNDTWQKLMEQLSEEFVNSTDSKNRPWLEAAGPPTVEMMTEFRTIAESLYINMRDCNATFLDALLSIRKFNKSDVQALLVWIGEPEPMKQLTIDCRAAEAQLLEERRQRLEAIAAEMASDHLSKSTITLLNALESALIARNPSEVTVEDDLLRDESLFIPWKRFVSNASLALKKEFYELVRDVFLDIFLSIHGQFSSWRGYEVAKAYMNWTEGVQILRERERPEAVLNITITFGKAFNLHYVEAEREDSSVDSEAPAFGTLTYLDAEPENLGVRRLRHILNGFVRLYFRVINRLGPCQSAEEPRLEIDVL